MYMYISSIQYFVNSLLANEEHFMYYILSNLPLRP